jgi:hypothetical protein
MGWKPDSHMIGDIWEEVRSACAKPISDLTADDLYHLLIHQVAPATVVPQALGVLEDSPLISSGRFPGDLLQTLLRLPESYWEDHHDHWMRAHSVLHSVDEALKLIERPRAAFLSVIASRKAAN